MVTHDVNDSNDESECLRNTTPKPEHWSGDLISCSLRASWACLVVQTVKNLPAIQETCVQSLDWKDPLEKGTATHSSIPVWRISWTEEPGGLQSMGPQRVGHD